MSDLLTTAQAAGRLEEFDFKAGRMSHKGWIEPVHVNASSAEDRKLLAMELIRAQPFFSDLSIGRRSNLSDKTIKRIRRNAHAPTREEAIKDVIVKSSRLSNSELSRITGASRGTIGKYRKELSNV